MAPPLFRISYRARTDEARARTKRLRKAIGKDTKTILKASCDKRIVPRARRNAPSIAAPTIVARATTRSAYITTSARGKKRRIIGLLEYGGTVRAWIRAGKKAIHFRGRGGGDVFVSVVKGPRTYKAKLFIGKAVARERRGVLRDIERQLPKAIKRHLGAVADVDGGGGIG